MTMSDMTAVGMTARRVSDWLSHHHLKLRPSSSSTTHSHEPLHAAEGLLVRSPRRRRRHRCRLGRCLLRREVLCRFYSSTSIFCRRLSEPEIHFALALPFPLPLPCPRPRPGRGPEGVCYQGPRVSPSRASSSIGSTPSLRTPTSLSATSPPARLFHRSRLPSTALS